MNLRTWIGCAAGASLAMLICAGALAVRAEAPAAEPTLADYEAIETTLYHYTRGLDRHDADMYASAWAEDGEFDLGPTPLKGRAAMRGIITGLIKSDEDAKKAGKVRPQIFHMDANSRIEFLAPDHAIHHAYFFTIGRTGTGLQSTNTIIAIGSTTDELKKINGEWLIVKRVVMNDP